MDRRQEITDLTLCRAAFAAWVFTYHVDLYLNFSRFAGPLAGLIRHGYMGVDGFFMLSGLILVRMHPEFDSQPELNNHRMQPRPLGVKNALRFFTKRLARIYPVHLATLLLLALILAGGLAAGIAPRDAAHFTLASLGQNLALVHGWGFASQGGWNYPSWSISVEWAGYLLFPGLCWLVFYCDALVAIQLAIISLTALGLLMVLNHGTLNLPLADGLLRFFPEFLIGIATARFVPVYADYAPIRVFAVAGALATFFSAMIGFDLTIVAGIWLLLFAFTLQADAQRPALLGSTRLLRGFGLLSYAFYMSFAVAELLISQEFRHLGWAPAQHGWVFGLGMLAITFALAITLHGLVENPCRRAADRWLAKA